METQVLCRQGGGMQQERAVGLTFQSFLLS